jgi:hypothetical protein
LLKVALNTITLTPQLGCYISDGLVMNI